MPDMSLSSASGFNEKHPDKERLDWLEKYIDAHKYHSDVAFQWDEEDGLWFARLYERGHGELRGESIDASNSKKETLREAIDAARKAEGAQK